MITRVTMFPDDSTDAGSATAAMVFGVWTVRFSEVQDSGYLKEISLSE